MEERRCKVCKSGVVENEFYFIFSCTFYNNIRANQMKSNQDLFSVGIIYNDISLYNIIHLNNK